MSGQDHGDALRDAAALYALGALEPEEARQFAARLANGDPTALAETSALASVVERLGHAASPIAPAPGVRARLLDAIQTGSRVRIVRADEGEWETTPAGTVVKRLLSDPIGRRLTSLVSMRGGTTYPSHRHVDTEELYILEGELDVHGHRLGPGDYCAALGGSVHQSASTQDGCRFLVSASEDDELLPSAKPSRHGLLFVPDGRGVWHHPEPGVAVRRVAIDSHFGVASVLVRMAPGSRSRIGGQQIYVLEGEARAESQPLRPGDFCGTVMGTAEVTESHAGCLLLVLSARGAIAGG